MALVTISMPVWRTPPTLLRRAIDAVRAQTFPDWRLVVLGDGDDPGVPSSYGCEQDRRITFANLTDNRGRYFADAVVFEATDSPLFAVHDSDDAARPQWLEKLAGLLYSESADAALSAQTVHRFGGSLVHENVAAFRGATALHHHAHMAGVWRRSWLAEIGGPHPAFRVGFDTLLTSLPYLVGQLVSTSEALYDRHKRAYSLTTDIVTGMRSELRARTRRDLEALYGRILAELALADSIGTSSSGRRYLISEVLSAYPTPDAYVELRAEVEREAKRLRDQIGETS